MAQQYYNHMEYMPQGMLQPATMPSPYSTAYNYPPGYQTQQAYLVQQQQAYQTQAYQLQAYQAEFYQQQQYDPRVQYHYSIMSTEQQQNTDTPSSEGFSTSAAQYYCFYEPCASQSKSFKRKADLDRHISSMHVRGELIDCGEPTCHRRGDYGFSRRDKQIEHMREVHKWNIPKRGQSSR